MIHALKTEYQYFQDVIDGKKPFEVRCNDRNFMVGDFLALNELTSHPCDETGEHLPTGRCCMVEVTYVLEDKRFVKDGYVVLGIRPCCIGSRVEKMAYQGNELYMVPVYECKK